jgi:hypothetical protein
MKKFDVAVIGGGPAGMLAALAASEKGMAVALLEKNGCLGSKLLLTGNGRCNLTNAIFDPVAFAGHFQSNPKFLIPALSRFGPQHTIGLFREMGVEITIEPGGRVFPKGGSKALLKAIIRALTRRKVTILTGTRVMGLAHGQNRIQHAIADSGEISAGDFVLCTGGRSYPRTGSTGDGYQWLQDLGHSIVKTTPALTPLRAPHGWVKELQGVTLRDVGVTLLHEKREVLRDRGDVLFTHFGLSGPPILNISGKAAEGGRFSVALDLMPGRSLESVEDELHRASLHHPGTLLRNVPLLPVPARARAIIWSLSKVGQRPAGSLSKKEKRHAAAFVKNIQIEIAGTMGFNTAMVTRGGVCLQEVCPRTMTSRLFPNLRIAGEILDLDGPTGGFNLQMCWSTSYPF